MATMFSDPLRQRHLQQVIINLVSEGFELVTQSEFRAELVRHHRRRLFAREERIILTVDEYGRVHRSNR